MTLSGAVTGEIKGGLVLIFRLLKWTFVLLLSGAITGGIIYLLNKFGIFRWLFRKKTKKKQEKKEKQEKTDNGSNI